MTEGEGGTTIRRLHYPSSDWHGGCILKLEAACAKRKYSQGGLYYAELGVDVSHYRLNRGGARTHRHCWYGLAHRMGVIRRLSDFIPRQFRHWTSHSTRIKTCGGRGRDNRIRWGPLGTELG